MRRGRIIEQGSPYSLIQKQGHFFSMVQHTGKNAKKIKKEKTQGTRFSSDVASHKFFVHLMLTKRRLKLYYTVISTQCHQTFNVLALLIQAGDDSYLGLGLKQSPA